jgi:hypothetical protein
MHHELKDHPSLVAGIDEWIQQAVLPSLRRKTALKHMDIAAVSFHNGSANEMFCQALEQDPNPTARVIIPMRDPLLSVLSELRRGSGLWRWKDGSFTSLKASGTLAERLENHKHRRHNIIDRISRFKQLLSFKDRCCIFPIDTPDLADASYRMQQCRDALNSCGLQAGSALDRFVANWQPIAATKAHIDGNSIKTAIIENDTETVKETLSVEFEHLHKDDILKKQLEDVGYQDLLWF